MQWTRREFLMGCSAAIAAMAAARIGHLAFAEPAQPQATNEIFVQIFLLGDVIDR
ncbi:twin-arginine translocation signal domain-containing protein [Chloroflexus aggregans]|uniref:twin-arginine translocation signal domain-containing protein n=1 Tax=Chloroflexus aggregans TaxID=152260 RepID=UPI0000E7E56E|nr:twin-arginine translocation signal domain-containing protein [Chloroflexus aggregans]